MQPSYSYFSLQITNAILRLPLYIFARKVLKFMLFGEWSVECGVWMGAYLTYKNCGLDWIEWERENASYLKCSVVE